MKLKSLYLGCLLVVAGTLANFSTSAYAGGNTGQMIAKFEPAKSTEQLTGLGEGDSVIKICRACRNATLVRIEKGGKGLYDVVAKKCEDCGSDDTYVAIAKQHVPFKEQVKR
jgi:hypothetical protein